MSHYNVTRKPAVNPQGAWANASYEFTWAAEEVADGREDLIVKICPDAAYDDSAYDREGNLIIDPATGEPAADQNAAVTFMELGVIEINPNLLPTWLQDHPELINPLSRQDRKQYPVVWGALIHETAHANHSLWVMEANRKMSEFTPEERRWLGAAMLLEESRIEKKQIDRRPQDQPWVEAAGLHVAVKEYADACDAVAKLRKENPVFQQEGFLSRYQYGRAAALALARVDSGSVFPGKQIDSIRDIVKEAFGKDYNKLRAVWLEAQDTDDNDLAAMLALGHRWYDLTRDSGDDQQPCGVTVQGLGSGQGEDAKGLGRSLADSADEAQAEASGEAEAARHRARVNARAKASAQEAASQQSAHDTADKTFNAVPGAGAGMGGRPKHPVAGHRHPTREEISRARATRRRLEAAYIPEKSVTRVTQAMPPGRLSVRDVQQRAAQRAQGMIPNAEPFTYTDRKHNSTPPLKVGIVQDVSGSQSGAAAAAVSGAWSLAKAAVDIPGAQVAMVSFGDDVHAIIKPNTRTDKVPMLSANAGTHHFLAAVKAVEGQLNLTRPGAARLLVILTDGDFTDSMDQYGRDAALRRLTSFGVKILWVDTDGYGAYLPAKLPGLRISSGAASGNYSAIPSVICHEAVNALTQ